MHIEIPTFGGKHILWKTVLYLRCGYCQKEILKMVKISRWWRSKTWRSPSSPQIHQKYIYRGFPGGAVVESLPASAGDTGSSPGLGGSHMPRSSWACEPQLLSLCVWSLCSAAGEAAMVRGPRTAMKSGPHLPQLGKALAQK